RRGGKYILKRLAAGLVPQDIIDRPKHGFRPPLDRWFRAELRPMVEDLLLGPTGRTRGFFDGAAVAALWRRYLAGDDAPFLRRRPRRYLGALGRVLALAVRQWRYGSLPLRTLVVFPMSVYFARVMAERGVTHVHAHFANHPTTVARAVATLLGVPFTFTG